MQKDYDRWNKIKKKINQRGYRKIKAGEIWWCALGLNIGVEQDGDNQNFQRPVVIICKFSNQIVLAAPLTTKDKIGHWYLKITYLNKLNSKIILNQAKPIDVKRLVKKIGEISEKQHNQILEEYTKLINKKRP